MGVSRCIARGATLVVFTTNTTARGRPTAAVYPQPVVRLLHFKLSTTVTEYFLYAQILVWGRGIKSFTVCCSIFAGRNLFIAGHWVARVACSRHVSRRRACRVYRVRCATDTPRTYSGWRQHRQRRRRSQGRAARATPAPRPASSLWRHCETSKILTNKCSSHCTVSSSLATSWNSMCDLYLIRDAKQWHWQNLTRRD